VEVMDLEALRVTANAFYHAHPVISWAGGGFCFISSFVVAFSDVGPKPEQEEAPEPRPEPRIELSQEQKRKPVAKREKINVKTTVIRPSEDIIYGYRRKLVERQNERLAKKLAEEATRLESQEARPAKEIAFDAWFHDFHERNETVPGGEIIEMSTWIADYVEYCRGKGLPIMSNQEASDFVVRISEENNWMLTQTWDLHK
jgi:hypothetical protein